MIRNSKAYGILTTWRGWCFAMRRDGGQLFLTRMFRHGPEATPSYRTPAITIMKAIYYFSHLVCDQPDLPETTQGRPGRIWFPYASLDITAAAPLPVIVRFHLSPGPTPPPPHD